MQGPTAAVINDGSDASACAALMINHKNPPTGFRKLCRTRIGSILDYDIADWHSRRLTLSCPSARLTIGVQDVPLVQGLRARDA